MVEPNPAVQISRKDDILACCAGVLGLLVASAITVVAFTRVPVIGMVMGVATAMLAVLMVIGRH